MSSPRLLVGVAAAAIASAALPATASATLKRLSPFPTPTSLGQYGYGTYTDEFGNEQPKWTSDGILIPGESVNVDFPLIDDVVDGSQPYDGTASGQLFENESGANLTIARPPGNPGSTTIRPFPPFGGAFQNDVPYTIGVSSNLVCGTNVPLRLSFGALGPLNITYGLPTGAVGAYNTTSSYDVGNIVSDGGTKDSKVVISDPGLLKGLRIHIDSIEHQYSTHWLKIKLVAPDGKEAVLFNQAGAVANGSAVANKHLKNVTFSETKVNGQAPVDASLAAQSDFTNQVISPVDSFSVFDGETLQGTWHLVVGDVAVPLDSRANHRGRTANLSGDQMFQLGDWDMQAAPAVCDPTPQAWLPNPLFVDPDGGAIDASGSYAPVPGRTITSWEWDTNTANDPLNGTPTFESTTSTPTLSYPATLAGSKTIKLRVTDSTGAVSAVVTRTLVITKMPVFDASVTPTPTSGNLIGVSPATPQAGETVTLQAHATDAESTPQQLTYKWDLNDDGGFDEGAGSQVTYAWATSGPHIVRVKVTDNQGASTVYYQTVTIANLPPVAKVTYSPTVGVVGQEMTFDGSGSTDADGTIVTYNWDLDGNGVYETSTATPILKYTYTQPGDQFVRMEAIDNTGGTDVATLQFKVTGAPVGVITASPASPVTGETVSYSASGSHDSDPGGSIAKYEWDLDGNGSWDVTGAAATTATRSYPNAGAVSVRLRLTDNDGATSITTASVLVRNPAQTGGTGGGTPTPTPTPTPKPGGGTTVVPPTGTTGGTATNTTLFPTVDTSTPTTGGSLDRPGGLTGGTTPPTLSVGENGFIASLATGAKQHGSKTYKKGIAVNFKANGPGTVAVSLMVLPKDAKTVGLKLKGTKLVKIGAGKAVLKKAGVVKLTVVVAKKYQRFIKKAKKLPVELRAAAISKDTGDQLAVGRKFIYVK